MVNQTKQQFLESSNSQEFDARLKTVGFSISLIFEYGKFSMQTVIGEIRSVVTETYEMDYRNNQNIYIFLKEFAPRGFSGKDQDNPWMCD